MTRARTPRWLLLGSWLVPALLAAGCGEDDRARTYTPVGRGRDAGPPRDAAGPEPPRPDAAAHDMEVFAGDRYLCGWDDDDALVLPGSAAHGAVATAERDAGFALAFHDAQGSVFLQAVPIAGAPDDAVRVLASGERPASTALAASRDGFLLAWRAGEGGHALRARELSTTEHPVRELSASLAPNVEDGERSAVMGEDDAFVAAWLDAAAGGLSLRVQRLDRDGVPQDEPRTLDAAGERVPLHLELARLPEGRTLLAWLERGEDGEGRIVGMPLSPGLEPEAEPEELSRGAVAGGRFDLAGRAQSAGLIYAALDGGVREAIKFRRIDADGVAREAVLNVVDAPGRALHGSIAPFGQGFAVAYRALPSLGVPAPVVRAAFIDQGGQIVYEAELAESTAQGGPTAIAATRDGHLLLGWTSEWPSGPATHALSLHCPGALELCGGQVE